MARSRSVVFFLALAAVGAAPALAPRAQGAGSFNEQFLRAFSCRNLGEDAGVADRPDADYHSLNGPGDLRCC